MPAMRYNTKYIEQKQKRLLIFRIKQGMLFPAKKFQSNEVKSPQQHKIRNQMYHEL